MKTLLLAMVLAAGLATATGAHAQYGFTTRDVNVRAGPAREYPLVAWLPVGTVVEILGCLADWRWCEIGNGPVRGFVYAGFLGYPYEGGYVIVRDAGPYLGLAVVPFVLENYWDAWYADRPWYPQWRWWSHRPPPGSHPPRPPHRPPQVRPLPPGQPPAGIVPPMRLVIPPITQPVQPLTPTRPARAERTAPPAPKPR